MPRLEFPNGFLWGSGTAAHQIEGNNTNSDWWQWEQSPERIAFLKSKNKNIKDYLSAEACDSYNRYEEDFALAKELHHNAHRLSIEWARIEPTEGFFDEREVEHYKEVLRSAKRHGLKIFLTIHHFTNPQWFAEKGAFAKRQNIPLFLRYVRFVTTAFDEYVDFWITINEPEASYMSYLWGDWPPQKKNIFLTFRVLNNLISAHNQSADIIHAISDKPLGIACDLIDFSPISFWSNIFTTQIFRFMNFYVLRKTIQKSDFIGVNYYFHFKIGLLGRAVAKITRKSDMGFEVYPKGFKHVLLYLKQYNKPLYVTENGIADHRDAQREEFIRDHLLYMHQAISEGADVRGYLHWSLIDNFEWAEGYHMKFGLIHIDRENNLKRTIRPSAKAYAEICRQNYIE